MHSRLPFHGLASLLCAAGAFAAIPARAQSASAEDIAAARNLGMEGVKLASAGNCAGAIPKLAAAEKLYHAPTTLETLGECEISVGRLVDGTEALNRVSREPLAPDAPAPFAAAKQRAAQMLGPAQARIGKLHIHLAGPSSDQTTVTVDGVTVPSVLIDSDRPTDPGTHQVVAVAQGFRSATATVTVQEAGEATVTLKLEPEPNAAPPPAPPPQPQAPPPVAQSPSAPPAPAPQPGPAPASGGGGSNGLAIGSLVVGGVGIGFGAVFGALALGTKSSLDKACVPTKKDCPSSSQSDISNLGTQATLSTIGFGVGIVGVAVGAILLATSHGSEPAPAPANGSSLRVTPWIGWGSAGLGGTF